MNIGILAFTTPSFAPVADITVPAFNKELGLNPRPLGRLFDAPK